MFELSPTGRLIILGVAIPTSALLIYWLLRPQDDEDEGGKGGSREKGVTSRQTVIEMSVPSSAAGQIIGRQGANIKKLQENSGARIMFKDDHHAEKTGTRKVIIRGTAEAAQIAECSILELISNIPEQFQEEMMVPGYSVGRIIGKGGETVKNLSRASKAKIYVDRTTENSRDKPRQITITGSRDQITLAKNMIQEKVEEEEAYRAKDAVSAANQQTRQRQTVTSVTKQALSISEVSRSNENWDAGKITTTTATVEFPKGDDYVNVYVSAIAHPGHFWVQLVTHQSVQLDEMSNKMTAFYKLNCKDFAVQSVTIGDMVAAQFKNDNTWYRAKVMEINGKELDLFYIDYGDSEYMDISQVCTLRQEFLELPFQAIECRLANVMPNSEWTEEAFDRFEALTYCAKWKVIVARVEKFDGTIPYLTLIDTNSAQDVNINKTLVDEGFAV